MGVAYSVGEVDHLYTFFVEWTPDLYTKHGRKQRFLMVDKQKLAMIDSLLSESGPKNWEALLPPSFSLCSPFTRNESDPAANGSAAQNSASQSGSESVYDKCNRSAPLTHTAELRAHSIVNMRPTMENIKILYYSRGCEEPYVEIITVRKSARSQSMCSTPSVCTSEDEEETLPALNHTSYILQEHHIESLAAHLPPRVQGCVWDLVYSTAQHGTSLRTLYRKTAQIERPVLLLIKDLHNQVFGAFSSDTFRVSDSCYGTGETFLFTFGPEFKTFCWSGENSYFVRGFLDSLQMGGGGGPFGLWLDADLCRGATFSCNTFRNQPLSLHQDFTIQAVEVWTFQ
ncbi:hypothetical protein AOLI_G00257730 [Acnodon oligacanthus]